MKKRIGVVCGGYSREAEVSFRSAEMIMNNIDRSKYEPVRIVIQKDRWYADLEEGKADIDRNDFSYSAKGKKEKPELCLIIIHGTPGEDGTLQGYFDMIGMPYTTGSVLNTSLTFNKIFTTDLLRQRGFSTAKGVLLEHPDDLDVEEVASNLAFPLFVKPNEGGSSIGVSKVLKKEDLRAAVEKAYREESDILIEEYLDGREFTCGVLCSKKSYTALEVTEISTEREFFDFTAKYTHDKTREITPAPLPKEQYAQCREISVRIARSFSCRGVVRIDYKLVNDVFHVIEINTVPGMTEFSLVPQQAAPMGISKQDIIDFMIETALA